MPDTLTDNVVALGSRVTMKDEASGREDTYTLVPALEANLSAGKLSFDSPLARALLGARATHTVAVHTPRGERRVTVISLN
jgi:transcription elongation factor GreA